MSKTDGRKEREARLDAVGRELLRASAADADELEAAASSPFLYARVRARVAAERARREESDDWRAALRIVRRAVPTVAVVAALALALFISALVGTTPSAGRDYGDETLLGERDTGVEHVVFVEMGSLTSDEVLATIIDDEREAQR
jgi:anti-sigma-K factor RskA